MKILWLINVALPEVSLLFNLKSEPFGGWLIGASANIKLHSEINLSIAFPINNSSEVIKKQGDNITYYAFPSIKESAVDNSVNIHLLKIITESQPDIVNIYGTENAHTLKMVQICRDNNIKVVVSIQGLVSIISKHFYSSLPNSIISGYTFRDLLKSNNISKDKKRFEQRGNNEVESIKRVDYVIGRTTFDYACTKQINEKIKYYNCNEILREEFYLNNWNIDNCDRFTIFMTNGCYPVKGLHYMLEAMPLILKKFPSAKLYVAGHNLVKSDTLIEKLKVSSYAKYIKTLINKHKLHNNVFFTGILNEKEISEFYLKSHVYVLPSSIENSPNSLAEAMIIGLPCVASNVGGVPNMMIHNEEGYIYQHNAYYMLAHYICEIFNNNELSLFFSENAKKHAKITHDKERNTTDLINIYHEIYNSDK